MVTLSRTREDEGEGEEEEGEGRGRRGERPSYPKDARRAAANLGAI